MISGSSISTFLLILVALIVHNPARAANRAFYLYLYLQASMGGVVGTANLQITLDQTCYLDIFAVCYRRVYPT